MTNLATIQELSAAGRHQECLQACQNALQGNPEEAFAYKYAGQSLLALGQLEKAHQCLDKALAPQEEAMNFHKERHPEKIFTFDYDKFVNAPEANLSALLEWR